MVRIFISYTSSDGKFADKLATDLSSFGAYIFYAKWEIKVGDSIVDKINKALTTHDYLVVILSKNSVNSEWVQRELNSSLMRQLKDKDIKIKPVLIQDCDIPALLSDIKYADFRHDYNKGFTSLIDSFQEDFDLVPYIDLIKSQFPSDDLAYDKRTLAILLKRLLPLTFACTSILYTIYDNGEIFETKEYSNEFIHAQLQRLIEDSLIFEHIDDNKKLFKFTDLGKIVSILIRAGLNEGLISPVCSH